MRPERQSRLADLVEAWHGARSESRVIAIVKAFQRLALEGLRTEFKTEVGRFNLALDALALLTVLLLVPADIIEGLVKLARPDADFGVETLPLFLATMGFAFLCLIILAVLDRARDKDR